MNKVAGYLQCNIQSKKQVAQLVFPCQTSLVRSFWMSQSVSLLVDLAAGLSSSVPRLCSWPCSRHQLRFYQCVIQTEIQMTINFRSSDKNDKQYSFFIVYSLNKQSLNLHFFLKQTIPNMASELKSEVRLRRYSYFQISN